MDFSLLRRVGTGLIAIFRITVAYPRVPGERPRSRNSPLPRHSTNTFVWCSDDDKTYLIVELLRAIRGNEIRHLVEDAYLSVQDHIHRYGDGVISYAPGPVFVYMGVSRLTVRIRNASIGYTTWAALGSALVALDDFMTQTSYGSVSFSIHDETGEVGLGTIG